MRSPIMTNSTSGAHVTGKSLFNNLRANASLVTPGDTYLGHGRSLKVTCGSLFTQAADQRLNRAEDFSSLTRFLVVGELWKVAVKGHCSLGHLHLESHVRLLVDQ